MPPLIRGPRPSLSSFFRHPSAYPVAGAAIPDATNPQPVAANDEDYARALLSSGEPINPTRLLQLFRSIRNSAAALRLFEWCRHHRLEVSSSSNAPSAYQAIFELAASENGPGNLLRLKNLFLRTIDQGYSLTQDSGALLIRSFAAGRLPSDALLAFRRLDSSLRQTHLCNNLLGSLLRSPYPNHRAEALSLLRDMLRQDSCSPPDSTTCSIIFLRESRSNQPADDETLSIIVQMANLGAFPNDTYQFTKVVVALCRAGRTAKAWDLVYTVKSAGGAVEVPVWNALLTGLSNVRDFSRMSIVFSGLEAAGLANVVTYGIIINHLCKSRRVDEALKMIDKMTHPDSASAPDAVIFNNLIDGLCKVGRVRDGLGLLDRMRNHHCNPNTVTFNGLIDGFCKAGEIDTAHELVGRMEEEGIPPNIVTLNSLISGMCRNGMVRKALSFFHEKKIAWAGSKGNSITYCTLIGACLHENNASKAMELFDEMIQEGHSPDSITYFTLISGLSSVGKMDEALSMASNMMKDGFRLDTKSYNILICGCAQKQKKLEKAQQLFDEMSNEGVKPDVVTYNILIDAYCKAGDFSNAENLLSRMIEANFWPSAITYGTLIHGFCQKGDIEGAVKIFRSMEGSAGVRPNTAIYNILIAAFCKSGEIGKGVSLFDEMPGNGVPRNVVTYNAVLRGLCEKNMAGKAFEVMDQMKEEGSSPDVVTMEILTGWLPDMGEIERLRFFAAPPALK